MLPQRKLVLSLALLSFTVPASAEPIVYVLTGSQQFGQMDLASGTFTPSGPIPATIQYLVPGPNGSLLTMSFDGDLLSIDPKTGSTAVIGATGFTDCLRRILRRADHTPNSLSAPPVGRSTRRISPTISIRSTPRTARRHWSDRRAYQRFRSSPQALIPTALSTFTTRIYSGPAENCTRTSTRRHLILLHRRSLP